MSRQRLLPSLPLLAVLALSARASDEPTLEQRLERLATELESAREAAHVPGMSLVVVRDGEVVLARGFGLADVEAERPADEETLYAIGSTTKAFTATLAGMLVDDGALAWDDPVTRHLSYFDLEVRSDDPEAECTLRDLLSHRHGFSRMGMLWFGNGVSREEILRTAAGAEPWDDFRAGFHYCNVAYLAAGEASGAAAGKSWDELVRERIFGPLGMTSSTLSVAEVGGDERLARGYEWDEDGVGLKPVPMVELANIAPAGSVNSNVRDLGLWLRFLLAGGELDGRRLIAEETLRETWSPQIAISPGVEYGLGWMLREHGGRAVVEHGGNIDGFSAQVAFMPEEGLGFALLSNLSTAQLRTGAIGLVFDALLEEWPAAEAGDGVVADAPDLDAYAGIYVASFASFDDEEFEILVQEDGLALDIPSQQTFALKAPDGEGLWKFALTDTIAVSFDRNAEGDVVALRMHQGGFVFDVPRAGVEAEPEVAAEVLQPFLGEYLDEKGRKAVVSLHKGALAIDPGSGPMPLETPDEEGNAPLRARADLGAVFERDAEGSVIALTFQGMTEKRHYARRASGDGDDDLPELEAILALRGTEARAAAFEAGGTRMTGEAWLPQAGLRGAYTVELGGPGRYAEQVDFGKFGRLKKAVRDGEAWSHSTLRGFERHLGDELAQALTEHPGAVGGDWSRYFDRIEVARNDVLNGRPVHVVRLKKEGLPGFTYWVDAETGDVLRSRKTGIEGTVKIPITTNYYDFEEVDGIRVPMRVEAENPASGKTVLTVQTIDTGLELGPEAFTLVDPGARD